jgi:hypothetical protein
LIEVTLAAGMAAKVGPAMQRMLASMAVRVVTGLGRDGRSAARAAG